MSDDIRTTVTLPRDVHERIRQLAERERRTVNLQILWLVERGLEATGQAGQDQEARAR